MSVEQTKDQAQIEAFKARIEDLKGENTRLKEEMSGMVEMDLSFQEYIPNPPVSSPTELYDRACSNDKATISSWHKQWIAQIKENKANFDFEALDVMTEFGKNSGRPVIIAGSGPSLKKNAHLLADKAVRGDIPIVSCLHNFGYFIDKGVHCEYYLTLDAGDITIGEMYEGGEKDEEYYWEQTKNHTLLAVIHANPILLKKWRGKILFFNAVTADEAYVKEMRSITKFKTVFNVGGNALGACLYMARAILGSCMVAFVGADFCFSYAKKFHSWDSPYDQQFSGTVPWTDIFGNRVHTWTSYLNFKYWFDYIACGGSSGAPLMFINCTEGGILGAYTNGNIRQIQQRSLSEFLDMVNFHNKLPAARDEHEYALLF